MRYWSTTFQSALVRFIRFIRLVRLAGLVGFFVTVGTWACGKTNDTGLPAVSSASNQSFDLVYVSATLDHPAFQGFSGPAVDAKIARPFYKDLKKATKDKPAVTKGEVFTWSGPRRFLAAVVCPPHECKKLHRQLDQWLNGSAQPAQPGVGLVNGQPGDSLQVDSLAGPIHFSVKDKATPQERRLLGVSDLKPAASAMAARVGLRVLIFGDEAGLLYLHAEGLRLHEAVKKALSQSYFAESVGGMVGKAKVVQSPPAKVYSNGASVRPVAVYSYQYQEQLMASLNVAPAAVTSKVQQVLQTTGEVTAVQGAFIQAETGKPFPLQMFVAVTEGRAPRAIARIDDRPAVTIAGQVDLAHINPQLFMETMEAALDNVPSLFKVQTIWTATNEATSGPD